MPILPIAIALVAIMAGGALFMSGYSLGAKSASQPGTPASEDEAFQPFWDAYHSIDERYAGGEIDRDALVQGAIKGMIDALGDPYSSYLTSEEYRDSLQGINGRVRRDRCRDRVRGRRTGRRAARRSGPTAIS